MANKEKLAEHNPAGFVPAPVADIYKCGIKELQKEYEKDSDGLSRFKPFSPGALQLEEEIQRQMASMNLDENCNNISDNSNKDESDSDSNSQQSGSRPDGSSILGAESTPSINE
jgi:hypothetical protein